MTSTASLHFGPEWMRKPTKGVPAPAGGPALNLSGASGASVPNGTPQPNGISIHGPTPVDVLTPTLPSQSSYSSLLTPTPPPDLTSDNSRPFRYSKEQMLLVWKNGGGHGELGLEVERWPGIVREVATEPMGLKEFTSDEKKVFSMSYNSDPPPLRRRGDSYSSHSPVNTNNSFDPGRDRSRLVNPAIRDRYSNGTGITGAGNPGSGRKRKDESTQEALGFYRTRQPSVSTGGLPGPPSPASISPAGPNTVRPRLTQTFDGVIGESWTGGTRRRVSEPRLAVLKTDDKLEGSWRTGPGISLKDDIAEESLLNWEGNQRLSPGQPSLEELSMTNLIPSSPALPNSASGFAPRSLDVEGSGSMQDCCDVENINWLYKDPTGQIQGPFAASLMQTWFSGGYFNEELLIQRIDIDATFEPLRDFRRRVLSPGTEDTLFLSQIAPKGALSLSPPGLADVRIGSIHSSSAYDELMSPVNSQSDTFLSPSTLPISNATETGAREWPPAIPISSSAIADSQRRDREMFLRSLREQELAAIQGQVHRSGNEAFALDPAVHVTTTSSTLSFGHSHELIGEGVSPSSLLDQSQPYRALPAFSQQSYLEINHGGFGQNPRPIAADKSLFPAQNPSLEWNNLPASNLHQSLAGPMVTSLTQPPNEPSPWLTIIQPSRPTNTTLPLLSDPFSQEYDESSQSGIQQHHEDSDMIVSKTHNSEKTTGSNHEDYISPQSSDLTTINAISSITDVDSNSSDIQKETSSITKHFAKLSTADYPEEPPRTSSPKSLSFKHDQTTNLTVDLSILPNPKNAASNPAGGPKTPKSALDSESQLHPQSSHLDTTGNSEVTAPENLPSANSWQVPKPSAWSTVVEEGSSLLHSYPAISLRQIQEAEVKRNAERKAEKDVRVAKTTPNPMSTPVEGAISWGLPQVGRGIGAPSSTAVSPALPSPAVNTAVPWMTRGSQTAKKSMKEIQEEEEARRRKESSTPSQQRETPIVVAAASKRGYADSAKASGITSVSGGVWTTVGVGGKPTAATPSSTSRPLVPATSLTRSSPITNANAPLAVSPAAPTKHSPIKMADEIPPPSLDFIKWMREALRGLTGVNADEFIQMLLSFPLDPSEAVLEIISDSIYSNSSTLDGRRFASEFVNRRKLDVAGTSVTVQISGSTSATGGRVSLADVVKTQPKQVQSEWAYKVVKKKAKKGGN